MAFNIVHYSQQDPQWKNDKIGSGPDNIGYVGCALTCVAMYLSGWGFVETPGSLNRKLRVNGGFIKEAIVWGAVNRIYPQINSTGLTICTNTDAPLAQIDASLAAGQPLIVEVDFSPASGLQTHWILLYAKKDNDYLVLDPWPYPSDANEVTLLSRFGHGRPPKRVIKAIAWYHSSISGPSPAPPMPPPVETDLYVRVVATATAGLRLRPQPSQDAPAIGAEMPGTQLHVIEEKDGALAKIGVNGQWIYIRDPQDRQGYVAAWYVEKAEVSTPPPGPAPSPTPPPVSTPPEPPVSEPQRMYVAVLQSVGTSGLRLRKVPSTGGMLVAVEKAGAVLLVLEPADKAKAKIGKAGQWLNVRDPNGLRGYVAAQYVQLKS